MMPRPTNPPLAGIYGQLPSQQASNILAQQQLLLQHREVEYFYAYVGESEHSKVGHWIVLEPDKTLSLENLRGYYSTCFGIKYNQVGSNNQVESKYVPYRNGYFQFAPGLDMNNTRFVAYYYNDVGDINAFMALTGDNNCSPGTVPSIELKKEQTAQSERNDLSFLHQSFDEANVMQRGAQSTPKPVKFMPVVENVSSTSDVILNEKTIEVISVHDSQLNDTVQNLPPPPPGPPQLPATPIVAKPAIAGIKAKLGPSVSSTSDLEYQKKTIKLSNRIKQEPKVESNFNTHGREKKPITIKVETAPKDKNMLNRYQATRSQKTANVNDKTPLKITLKRQGRCIQRDSKILKIEDEKGRTTALLTKRKWAGKESVTHDTRKRRYESDEDSKGDRNEKRRRLNSHARPVRRQLEPTVVFEDNYRTLNILLVGFRSNPPVIHETTNYFSDFGVVTNLELFTLDNRDNTPEYYAFMKIRTDAAVSLFADRHLYNGSVIYAIRVDDSRLPSRVGCKICDYQGLNVAYLNYHMEGQVHQSRLKKRLESLASSAGNVYRDSYYRITYDELYVQYPNDAVHEIVRNDYWKRVRSQSGNHGTAIFAPSNLHYKIEKGRNY
ncbi:uncharacterized protein LOC128739375 [Sabethes cyaneus]|uniref:uncharacterized protein LOC128739375 n=1 Tax=Sabethes cyaneus TaxID=53552 RepID=UPI00237DE257|nr:uncharacterized protein LOC128739375 [Sabethes cyaneus]